MSENFSSSANSESESSNTAGNSFMGVLSGLAAPKTSASAASADWNDDGLEDDVTTLSYESALRNIGRYKPTDASALNLPKDFDLASAASSLYEKLSAEKANTSTERGSPEKASPEKASPEKVSIVNRNYEAQPASATLPTPTTQQTSAQPTVSSALLASALGKSSSPSPSLAELRKRASVTIRLSEPEYEQLHKRAAEAGLTISAYLRSCTFEAEALRAQVKEALASLRAEAKREKPAAQTSQRYTWRERIARIRRSGITINV